MRKISLVPSILMTMFLTFLFMPTLYTMTYFKNLSPGVGHASEEWDIGVNICELNAFFIILIIVLSLASIALPFIQYINANNIPIKFKYFSILPPIATCVMFIIASIVRFSSKTPVGEPYGTASWGKYGFYEYSPNWGFFIALALVTIAAVLCVLLATGKIKDTKPTPKTNIPQNVSDADKLKKFKELLDSGLITQDEYDAKKKQLLGL